MEPQNTTAASIAAEIISLAEGRFIVDSNEQLASELQEITPQSLEDKLIIRLRRNWPNAAGERTLLIAVLASQTELKIALQWAAAVRDELLDPENGDLYLFAAIKDESLSLEQCTDVESSDRICRRYILRPNESIGDFLSRSFVAPVMSGRSTEGIFDPLYLALEKTADNHQWLTREEQKIWQEALLSGKSGRDLIDSLFHL